MLASLLFTLLGQLGIADELQPSFPDRAFAKATATAEHSIRVKTTETAIGMMSSIHVFVQAEDNCGVGISVSRVNYIGNPHKTLAGLALGRLHAVPVEENTGLGGRTEQFEGKQNPHVIRRAPFLVFDPIEPLPLVEKTGEVKGSALAKNGGVAFRLSFTPKQPGEFQFSVNIKAPNNNRETFRWNVNVYDFTLPPRSEVGFAYTNWFSPNEIADRHNLERWSPEFWNMLAIYANLMSHGGQDTFWLRWQDFFHDLGVVGWRLDAERLERYIRIFLDAGFQWIEGAPIARRPNNDWSKTWLELRFGKVPATSEGGEVIIRKLAEQVNALFVDKGWDEQWIQHLADEPTDVNAEDYRKLSSILRKYVPGIRIVEATMTRQLAGAVDIWCPQVHKYQQNRKFFIERQAAGDQVWTYTCLVPGGPWLNRLLDQERLRQVYLGWAGAHYNTQGFLHWGLNQYKADPFTQSVVDHPAQPNTTNKLPAGDTHIIYPGPDQPWSSTRFEAHRIGLEDLAMLRTVQKNNPSAAAEIIKQVFRNYDDWESSVDVYRRARGKLLKAAAEKVITPR